MPPRAPFLDVTRTSYVCQSCRAGIRGVGQRPLRPWQLHRYYSVGEDRASRRPPVGAKRQPTAVQVESPEAPIAVNYFNEEQPGRYRRVRDSEEYGRISGGLDEGVGLAIDQLEKQMEAALQMLENMDKDGMKGAADGLRKQYEAKLKDQLGKDASADAVEDQTPIPELRYIDLKSPLQRERVNALNSFLRLHQRKKGELSPKVVSHFWKQYATARRILALSWDKVPAEAWGIFWAVLSWDKGDHPHRMHHIHVLASDMRAAGVFLDGRQQLLAIEAMFLEGLQEGAIESWKKAAGSLGSQAETFRSYWELGVRMCSLHGDLERAARAATTLLESAYESDPRILLPLIQALAQKEATQEQAWGIYRRLRDLLGESMKIEDYDEVINCFLSTNCVEYALQAFVDMMFSGAIDVRGKTRLPAKVANRFFFGKWLKRLVGAGDLDGAYKVVCYMEQRGVLAAAIQLNGLLGAWLRSETADNVEKAERLAWAMIRARLIFVDIRRRQDTLRQWPVQLRAVGKTSGTVIPEDDALELKYLPGATLETFSLMADSYRKRRLNSRMEDLWIALKQAEVTTDSFMMNQMLESYVQDGNAGKAVEFYQTMTKEHGVSPDAHSFLALFKTLAVNRLYIKDKTLNTIDTVQARKIFYDMVTSSWGFATPFLYEHLPRTVLLTFYKLEDYAGLIVAVRTMQALFDFAPTEALLMELAAGPATFRSSTRQRNMKKLIDAGRSIEVLLRQRHNEGHALASLSPEERGRELETVLEMFIRNKAGVTEAQMQPALEAAADKMGAYDIVISPDAAKIAAGRKPLAFSQQA